MTNRALLVGIDYPNTRFSLRGCANDVHNLSVLLSHVYQFDYIDQLINEEATRDNILSCLRDIVLFSQPGDKIFFHFSGHGSQIINKTENSKKYTEEVLCPIDLNWKDRMIRYRDLNSILMEVAGGVEITICLDCCHSGDGFDFPDRFSPQITSPINNRGKMRYLEPPEHLKPRQELRFRQIYKKSKSPKANAILISCCGTHEKSSDVLINGYYCGACTHYLINCLYHHDWSINHRDLIIYLNIKMIEEGFSQRPELSGIKSLFDVLFLGGKKSDVDLNFLNKTLLFNLHNRKIIKEFLSKIFFFFKKSR